METTRGRGRPSGDCWVGFRRGYVGGSRSWSKDQREPGRNGAMFELIEEGENGNGASIKVIGVGGAGGNAVNRMIQAGLQGVEFIAANTDAQVLEQSLCTKRIQLGVGITKGLGSGANPSVGRQAAEEDEVLISEALEGFAIVFFTADMG